MRAAQEMPGMVLPASPVRMAVVPRRKVRLEYDRLGTHLAAFGAPVVTLTFAEIEAVVGPLPVFEKRTPPPEGSGDDRCRE